MNDVVLVALIGFAGTVIGSFLGVVASAKLTNYRIEQLEKKVDMHNNFARRIPVIEEQIKEANHRIEDLEREIKLFVSVFLLLFPAHAPSSEVLPVSPDSVCALCKKVRINFMDAKISKYRCKNGQVCVNNL